MRLRDADIRTSWMQKLPWLKRHFKAYLLFYPDAIERFNTITARAWSTSRIGIP